MSPPFLEQLLTGSGLLYFVVGLLVTAALMIRRLSKDRNLRRRALFVAALLLLFALLQVVLGQIPEHITGRILTPAGEWVPGAVKNPTYRYVSVTLLLVGLLAALMVITLLFVDFLFVDRLGFEIPNILRDVSIVAIFFTGTLVILSARTGLDPTGIFTTAGVISIVIGLALQDTLGNVFSGLALQTERSFNVGDWVRFDDHEGVVTDISWRATKLRTRDNDYVIVPNSVISKDVLINYSAPTRIHAIHRQVGAHYRHPPAEVIAAIEEAADQTDGVLPGPTIDVRTQEFADFAVVYDVKFWIRDYTDVEEISNAFMTRIWYAFDRRQIEIPFPIRQIYTHRITPESEEARAGALRERIFRHLRAVEVFDPLTEEEARSLARRARIERFFTGEVLMRQGEPGDSMYIVDHGRVEVEVSRDGRSRRLAELGPAQFIGEMALMLGAERSATVVALEPTGCIVIDRDAFRETLEANPRIAEGISEMLAERRRELEATTAALHEAARKPAQEDKGQILSRIREFFGFGGFGHG